MAIGIVVSNYFSTRLAGQFVFSVPLDLYRSITSLGTIVLLVVVLMLIGIIPTWPHSRGWGYGPSSGLGIVFAHPTGLGVDGQAIRLI